ncbi:hypothetical protein ANCDUO_09212 [Ancylostoma duodenale]|uniref:Uncharacterized protein n=1 Tax=Ancylostoma duodenale TaxID=51022 RepID=A0A0C2GN80_9BILA|nr:hypothetical protein ANCDUO_09212 [Ancylostoma duodenale]
MFHGSFYYTASFTAGLVPQPNVGPDDPRAPTPPMVLGVPMPTQPQFYASFPPNYYQFPIPAPDYSQLPTYPTMDTATASLSASYYSSELGSSSAVTLNTSYYSSTSPPSQAPANDPWLDNSLTSVRSGDDQFVGTFAPSYRGAAPVLLYRIPCTDLCYVYNRVRTTDGSRGHYVFNKDQFTKDPMAGGHICRPKSFAREVTSRHSARARSQSGAQNDSGFSSSFPGY